MKKPFLFSYQVFYNLGTSKMCSDKEMSLVYANDIREAEKILDSNIRKKEPSSIRCIKITLKTIL